jgi:PGF-CTERM protein
VIAIMKKERIESSILIGALLVGMLSMCILSTAIASRAAEGTQAVEYSKLIPFLPKAPSGWEAGEPQGFSFTHEEGTWSMASSDYSKAGAEDVTANVMITDYALYTTGWTGAWKSYYAWESTEGYAKTVTVQGYPAWEVHNKDSGDYSLSVAVNDRFLVFINTNSDRDTLYKFSDAINYKGIGGLGPGPTAQQTAIPTTQPTAGTSGTPTEEEGSKTPGFELIFAVIGILAVVALLVRRRG